MGQERMRARRSRGRKLPRDRNSRSEGTDEQGGAPLSGAARAATASSECDIAGWRALRVLARSERSIVYLGRLDDDRTAALKLVDAGENRITDQIEALEATQHSEHIVQLIDVGTAEGRIVLVLERLDPTLADLLRRRARLRPGELVTILVSVLRGLSDLHAAGYAHGALSPSTVGFDRRGRPVLFALGSVVRFGAMSTRADEACRSDAERFADLARVIVSRVDADGRDEECATLETALARLTEPHGFEHADAVEDALFQLGPPAPVLVREQQLSEGQRSDHALGMALPRTVTAETSQPPQAKSDPPSRAGAARLAVAALRVLEAGPAHLLRERIRRMLGRRRKLILLSGALAGALIITGLSLTPPGPSRAETAPRTPGSAEATSPRPSPPPSTPSPSGTFDAIDDPVAAAGALIAARARCLARRSGACLAAIEEPSSPLLSADTNALRTSSTAAANARLGTPSLVERTGGSALVEFTPHEETMKPASVLVIRTEAGWRLRELYAD